LSETTLLYILSTLAQTCAALAAFVGAVGLYRLQSLRAHREDLLRDMRGRLMQPTTARANVLAAAATAAKDGDKATGELLEEYNRIPDRLRWSRCALVIFEFWNLFLVAVSLVGFNYIKSWASSSWSFWGVWVTAIGTVAVTGYSVYAWTRE